ncbi:hypothetical protein CTA2_3830 [Colletotrichum tanaceti]|uniref:Uncharacterized protein n=1 Tax=Colletotrichum tanaceti TaxID=1306861 RepID=A0A4U6XK92_9PEZI|nr:hypothetical protein CTA2_3830 [Colletotrichum tanaceti]TKW56099.1 hypothetical protein CTA1_8253 [Colletotrichum tanaceti]
MEGEQPNQTSTGIVLQISFSFSPQMSSSLYSSSDNSGSSTPSFGRQVSLAFRPSSVGSETCSPVTPDEFADPPSSEILRVQPYLKYPGFSLPNIIIHNKNKGFIVVLRTNRDQLTPGCHDLPMAPEHMRTYVSLQVEAMFSAAVGVLYANEGLKPTKPTMWQKVQRVLADRDVTWRSQVSCKNIYDLVNTYSESRARYLSNARIMKTSPSIEQQYGRLLRTVDRWIALSKDRSSVSDILRFKSKMKWLATHSISKTHLRRDSREHTKHHGRMPTPASSDVME